MTFRRGWAPALIGLALATAALGADLPAGAGNVQPGYRQIKDWLVVCDNLRRCEARYAPAGENAGGMVFIKRQGGPTGQLELRLYAGDDPAKIRLAPERLKLDGKALTQARAWGRSAVSGEKDGLGLGLSGADAAGFLNDIQNGGKLDLGAGAGREPVLLDGLTAAMLAMDEAQGRLGNQSALVRKGPTPASTTPPEGTLPEIGARPAPQALPDAKSIAASLRRAKAKDLADEPCLPDVADMDQAWRLNATEVIVKLTCSLSINEGDLVYRMTVGQPSTAKPLVLVNPLADPREKGDPGAFTGAGYDPKSAILEDSNHSGAGSCGWVEQWAFDGHDFHLRLYRRQQTCGGSTLGDDWPTVFEAKPVNAK